MDNQVITFKLEDTPAGKSNLESLGADTHLLCTIVSGG
jgi:hypothetical protein